MNTSCIEKLESQGQSILKVIEMIGNVQEKLNYIYDMRFHSELIAAWSKNCEHSIIKDVSSATAKKF